MGIPKRAGKWYNVWEKRLANFADIIIQKQRLVLIINMKFADVYDPNGICRDVTDLGRWGNGDVELYMEHISDIDHVMEIVEQSYHAQADE